MRGNHPGQMGKVALLAALLAAAGGSMAAAGAAADPAPARLAFLPHWIPQAQFAGYYLALEKDFYRQAGLEVAILEGGPRKPVEKALGSGEAVIASHFLSSALKLRDEGIPLVHLAQISQRSALLLVARKARGIASVQDLEGKTVSVWPSFSVQPQALFRKYNLRVSTVTQGSSPALFLNGAVDAASAMWYNEYHLILNSGIDAEEMTLVFYDQHGLNFPEDCLLCLAETWRTRPGECRKFVAASLAGWRYAAAHREEALQVVMRRTGQARTGTNRAHQRWMLDRMCDLIQPPPGAAMGELPAPAYENVARELRDTGEIRTAPTFKEFHVAAHP